MFLIVSRVFLLLIFFAYFSINLSSQNVTTIHTSDVSVQPDVYEVSFISPTRFGQPGWGNCGAKFARDLRIYQAIM